MAVQAETERVRRYFDQLATRYDKSMEFAEKLLFGDGRRWVCTQARGDVLEIAAGTGRNLPFYPPEVRLTAIDISPAMLDVARRRVADLGRTVDLRSGDAQALAFPAAAFDCVVCTLSLCSIPDDARAVAEVRRVLRPGGRFLLLEHVRSPRRPVRLVQRLLDPLAVRFAADHLLREPLAQLEAEGFVVDRLERAKWGLVERVAATKPAP